MPYDPIPAARAPGQPAKRPWRGETYYGMPSLKASPWGWKVSAYIFIAGLAGSAQVIATVADLFGGERAKGIVRRGRHLALLAPAIGGPLLIADLHTPKRFYNMLRIFRRTSPMSIGTYVLSTFSLFSGAAAFLPEKAARAAQLPAAVAGAGMSTYTAALLAATSTPFWAAQGRPLAARFGCSAMATAAAALSLAQRADGEPEETCGDLDALAALATVAELAATASAERRARALHVAPPLENGATGAMDKWGAVVLGAGVPLLCYSLNMVRRRRSPALSVVGSLAVLAGGFVMRDAILRAGNRSARRPDDYFRFTQPDITAAVTREAPPARLEHVEQPPVRRMPAGDVQAQPRRGDG